MYLTIQNLTFLRHQNTYTLQNEVSISYMSGNILEHSTWNRLLNPPFYGLMILIGLYLFSR